MRRGRRKKPQQNYENAEEKKALGAKVRRKDKSKIRLKYTLLDITDGK